MNISFDELCIKLLIDPEQIDTAKLTLLSQWCYENISRDVRFDAKIQDYLALAKHYLDDFLPYIPKNINDIVPRLDDMDAVHYAAYHGYDRYLARIKLTDDVDWNQATVTGGMTALHFAAIKRPVYTF